ncbi:uncharacterized protein J7T54_001399 [Emericellopsis cladophorae]|uniref:Uncharacterized protein n=1 Tax=Emericellopsis cladophorae TaxID=2686198 RepID=A0A9P9XU51_9HYPO|nr:uncharacterized protein J7T54_001399 [Emericellopsis cladophorae]KAI6777790.1 hypothetical protein J7T54_001399 [Emericellopsis cladophorae]
MGIVQPAIPPTPSGTTLVGQTVIVTGGNAGIGFEACRQLLLLGVSRLIVASRTVSNGQLAVSALRADGDVARQNPAAQLLVFQLDLADYASGLGFAQRVNKEVPELDILINNGGQVELRFETAPTGHEKNMQVNCYTHMLITLELLPLLRATARLRGAPSRVTFTGSITQVFQETLTKAPIGPGESVLGHWDDPKHFSSLFRYADTKLCVSAYCRKLAQLVSADEVIVNDFCPGLVRNKGLDRNLNPAMQVLMQCVRQLIGRSIPDAARALVYAAVVVGKEAHGTFLNNNQVHPGAAILDTPEGNKFTDDLWNETVMDLAKMDPALSTYVAA